MGSSPAAFIDVSVIMPAFNEADSIERVVVEVAEAVGIDVTRSYELLVIDDGSTDDTPGILRQLQARIHPLRVLTLAVNSGQSAAFAAGFDHARGRMFVTMDADGQNDPADIPRLLEHMETHGCCCGYRESRQDRWSRRVGSRLANAVRNWALGESIIDTGCSLKAVHAPYARGLQAWHGMHRFFPTLFGMRGASIHQIPVHHRPRLAGRSKYTNWGRLQRTIWDLMAVRWLKSRVVRYHVLESPDSAPIEKTRPMVK
jgi:glycosyltransferase involved in cell wall biosynthesis